MPVSRTVFEVAAKRKPVQEFALAPPHSPHPRVPPHRRPGASSHGQIPLAYFSFNFSFPAALFSSRNVRSCGAVSRSRIHCS